MKDYQKLVEKLCEVPEIEKDIKELRFGCGLEDKFLKRKDIFVCYLGNINCVKTVNTRGPHYFDKLEPFESRFKILGNPLEERHLRMYCMENNILIEMFNEYIGVREKFSLPNKHGIYPYEKEIKLDNSKPFHKQDDKVYGQILDYLTKQ